MLLEKKETTELTEKQKTFLSVLFGEAQGDPRTAAEIAGYAPTSYPKVVQGLNDDGSMPGASIRMEAAKQILDRVGIIKREKIDIDAKIAHGIFILPAKEA